MAASPPKQHQRSRFLSRLFLGAFLFLLTLDFLSIFALLRIAGPTWRLELHGGCVALHLEQADSVFQIGPSVHLWFPIWNPGTFLWERDPGGQLELVVFPIWLLSLPFALAAILLFRRARKVPGQCEACGYNVEALPASTCPECGRAIDPPAGGEKRRSLFRDFASTHKYAARYSLVLVGIGFVGVFGLRALIWLSEKETTITVPNGYVGTILFIEDRNGAAPGGGWGKYSYSVPESGVARVTRIDLVAHFIGSPGQPVDIVCREENGTVIPMRRDANSKWFSIDGPYGESRLAVAQIWYGHEIPPVDLRLSPDEKQVLRKNGVPINFIAPHKIVPKDFVPELER